MRVQSFQQQDEDRSIQTFQISFSILSPIPICLFPLFISSHFIHPYLLIFLSHSRSLSLLITSLFLLFPRTFPLLPILTPHSITLLSILPYLPHCTRTLSKLNQTHNMIDGGKEAAWCSSSCSTALAVTRSSIGSSEQSLDSSAFTASFCKTWNKILMSVFGNLIRHLQLRRTRSKFKFFTKANSSHDILCLNSRLFVLALVVQCWTVGKRWNHVHGELCFFPVLFTWQM